MKNKTVQKICMITVTAAVIMAAGGCLADPAIGQKADGGYEAEETINGTTDVVENNDKSFTKTEEDLTTTLGRIEDEKNTGEDSKTPGKNVTSNVGETEESTGAFQKQQDNEEYQVITESYSLLVTDEEEIENLIPSQITRDGKTYVFNGNIRCGKEEEFEAVKQTFKVNVEEKTDLDRTVSYKSPVTGVTYLLKAEDATIPWGEPTAIKKTITEKIEFAPGMEEPVIQGQKTVTYENRLTGQTETAVGKLAQTKVSEPFFCKAEEPIKGVFAKSEGGTDSFATSYILPDGSEFAVPVDMENAAHPSWNGYEEDIIKILGLDPAQYRITGAGWAGDVYEGVEFDSAIGNNVAVYYRDAVYPYEALCRTYQATYEAEVPTMGYQTEVTYYAPKDELLLTYDEEAVAADCSTLKRVTVEAAYRLVK